MLVTKSTRKVNHVTKSSRKVIPVTKSSRKVMHVMKSTFRDYPMLIFSGIILFVKELITCVESVHYLLFTIGSFINEHKIVDYYRTVESVK